MSDATIVHLDPHERMTPTEALAMAGRVEWDDVIICGYSKDNNELVIMTSHMSREQALWLAEHFRMHVLDL